MPIAEMRPYSLLCLKLEFGKSAKKLGILWSDPQQQTFSKILLDNMVLDTEADNIKTINELKKMYLYSSSPVLDTKCYWYKQSKTWNILIVRLQGTSPATNLQISADIWHQPLKQ